MTTIFMRLILLWMLFALFILPIWILIHCATSTLRTRAKVLWILLMLVIWPIGSLLYGFFVSKKRFFQWSAGVTLVGLALAITFLFQEEERRASSVMMKVSHLDMSGISEIDQGKLKTALETLQREVNAKKNWLFRFRSIQRVNTLYGLFDVYAKDNRLTDVEYRDWMDKYNTRELIDPAALKEHVRQLKYKRRATKTPQ